MPGGLGGDGFNARHQCTCDRVRHTRLCHSIAQLPTPRSQRLLDHFPPRLCAMRAFAQHAPERTRPRQALIKPENMPGNVLQTIASRQMRLDVGTQPPQHIIAIRQWGAKHLVLDLRQPIWLVIRGAAPCWRRWP